MGEMKERRRRQAQATGDFQPLPYPLQAPSEPPAASFQLPFSCLSASCQLHNVHSSPYTAGRISLLFEGSRQRRYALWRSFLSLLCLYLRPSKQ